MIEGALHCEGDCGYCALRLPAEWHATRLPNRGSLQLDLPVQLGVRASNPLDLNTTRSGDETDRHAPETPSECRSRNGTRRNMQARTSARKCPERQTNNDNKGPKNASGKPDQRGPSRRDTSDKAEEEMAFKWLRAT